MECKEGKSPRKGGMENQGQTRLWLSSVPLPDGIVNTLWCLFRKSAKKGLLACCGGNWGRFFMSCGLVTFPKQPDKVQADRNTPRQATKITPYIYQRLTKSGPSWHLSFIRHLASALRRQTGGSCTVLYSKHPGNRALAGAWNGCRGGGRSWPRAKAGGTVPRPRRVSILISNNHATP